MLGRRGEGGRQTDAAPNPDFPKRVTLDHFELGIEERLRAVARGGRRLVEIESWDEDDFRRLRGAEPVGAATAFAGDDAGGVSAGQERDIKALARQCSGAVRRFKKDRGLINRAQREELTRLGRRKPALFDPARNRGAAGLDKAEGGPDVRLRRRGGLELQRELTGGLGDDRPGPEERQRRDRGCDRDRCPVVLTEDAVIEGR